MGLARRFPEPAYDVMLVIGDRLLGNVETVRDGLVRPSQHEEQFDALQPLKLSVYFPRCDQLSQAIAHHAFFRVAAFVTLCQARRAARLSWKLARMRRRTIDHERHRRPPSLPPQHVDEFVG